MCKTVYLLSNFESSQEATGPQIVATELLQAATTFDRQGLRVLPYSQKSQFSSLLFLLLTADRHSACVHIMENCIENIAISILCKLRRIPLLVTIHSNLYSGLKSKLRRRLSWMVTLILANRIVAVSESTRKSMPGWLLPRTKTIMNGCKGLDQISSSIRFSARPGKILGVTRIAVTGGTRAEKGIPFLLASLETLQQFQFQVDIFGRQGEDHNQVINHQSANIRVSFMGVCSQQELWSYFRKDYDMYVQPSQYEPFGMAIVEALCCGLPVVATKECGVVDSLGRALGDCYQKVLTSVPYSDCEALARAIEHTTGGLSAEFAMVPIDVFEEYTWKKVMEHYRDSWEEVLEGRPR